ncbi:MAG: tryptophan halogenase family protein [Thalassotalea sp.]
MNINHNKNNKINRYVIVGGGTAGWISAAILSRALHNTGCEIVLVESPHTPTVGVGEATIPSIMDLLTYLKISSQDFIAKTNATFKLGIKFVDWQQKGQHYWHQFGYVGNKIDGKPFYQHWLKHHFNGGKYEFSDFSPAIAMAKQNKFFIPDPKKPNNLSNSTYALHFDAVLVAQFLSDYCQANQVQHIKAHINNVITDDKGQISSLALEDGSSVGGDFFIDCSGQHALLINKTLRVGLENWQQYLPVDRAVVMQTEKHPDFPPYTESTAHEHGWRWQIPLQNRTGNGYVYCSDFCDDESAKALLEKHVIGEKITDARIIKFTTGKRDKMWFKNCLAVGLSSGFLEPLESTSIHLIMKSMLNFVQMLPDKNLNPATITEFNRLMDFEYTSIRDFIVLHYCASARTDSAFWRMWQNLEIPATLVNKLALFKEHGRLYKNDQDLFSADSWYAVLEGMKVRPKSYDTLIDASKFEQIEAALPQAVAGLNNTAKQLLSHQEYLARLIDHINNK